MSVEERIIQLLQAQFQPYQLIVINDSSKHEGHIGSPDTGDSHFSITIAAEGFEGKSSVERHKMVYKCLDELMNAPIHALSISAFTPSEFNPLS